MPADQVPLYVRLATEPSRLLDQAVAVTGRSKRQLVEDAVRQHLGDQDIVIGRVGPSLLDPERAAPAAPDVLTLQEAAALLRVPVDEVEAGAIAGELPGRCIGAEWRFARAALLAWLGNAPGITG